MTEDHVDRAGESEVAPGLSLYLNDWYLNPLRISGARVLAGHLENVAEPEAAQLRVRLASGATYFGEFALPENGTGAQGRLDWTVRVDMTSEPPGPSEITIMGNVRRDNVAIRRTVVVAPRPSLDDEVIGGLDQPPHGAVVAGDVVAVRGWCLFRDAHVARVEVFVDGTSRGLARPYVERPLADVTAMDSSLCGFEASVSVRRSERGRESLVTVEATSLDGRKWRSATHRVVWGSTDLETDEWAKLDQHVGHNATTVRGVPSDRSKVIVFAHGLEYAGAQLWLQEILRQFMEFHPDLDFVVVSPTDGPLRPLLVSMGVFVHITTPARLHEPFSYEGHVQEMALLIRSLGGGAALVNTLVMFPAVEACARAGVPVLWAIHESIEPPVFMHLAGRSQRVHPAVRERFEGSFRHPEELIFEAAATERLFRNLRGDRPTTVLHYGVDIDAIDAYRKSVDRSEIRARAGFGPEDRVLLVVGTEPRKGLGLIVAAFDELSVVHPDVHLVVVGAHPAPYFHALASQIERCRNADRVHLVDVTPDIFCWYEIADLLLCASDLESLPRSMIEAMAFELPIVSTDVFGISELIEDGKTGWLTRANDLEAFVGLSHYVLDKPAEELHAVSKAARAIAESRDGTHSYGRKFALALTRLLKVEHPDGRRAELQGLEWSP
ncbi:MAG TPA: glycosyltransferase [Acidimicrobiales bacterium]|nr:glycosyltransferase [Acidimicrobiales bacterium]